MYFSTMCSILLVAACLVSAGHAATVQTSSFQQQVKQVAEQMRDDVDAPELKMLAMFLLASSPMSAYTPARPATQPATGGGLNGVKMSTNPATLQQQQQQGTLSKAAAPPSVPSPTGEMDGIMVQGRALRTWSYRTSLIDGVQVVLSTDGRPLEADVKLWQGPDNTPNTIRVYSEDGNTRPFSAVIATPDDGASTVAIRNIGQLEFPFSAYVTANNVDQPISNFRDTSTIVQGGALKTWDFATAVDSIEIMIKTDGRPLNARIELLQGPNNNKQVIELYAEDGLARPFFAILPTMGAGNVVRVVNTAPLEFPMFASVQPHSINEDVDAFEPIIGGDERDSLAGRR